MTRSRWECVPLRLTQTSSLTKLRPHRMAFSPGAAEPKLIQAENSFAARGDEATLAAPDYRDLRSSQRRRCKQSKLIGGAVPWRRYGVSPVVDGIPDSTASISSGVRILKLLSADAAQRELPAPQWTDIRFGQDSGSRCQRPRRLRAAMLGHRSPVPEECRPSDVSLWSAPRRPCLRAPSLVGRPPCLVR